MSIAVSSPQPVLIAGKWRPASSASDFAATDPNHNTPLEPRFPVSQWSDVDEALDAAAAAFEEMRKLPPEQIAKFLEDYADRIDANKDALVDAAFAETGLAKSPRLADVELPRTSNQLRAAAAAARSGDWSLPTIDTTTGIRSVYRPLGPVAVFGPNNFPFAFGSVSGGDFAAAIAAGNPVIGKANSSHPETTRRFAELAAQSIEATGLPPATVQLLYRTSHADGERLVADPRIGATGYTGGRAPGLKLKAAADAAGKPIYLELSSVNPVVFTEASLRERGDEIAGEYVTSVLMGTGQFCTNPGLVFVPDGQAGDSFVAAIQTKFADAPAGTLLSPGVLKGLKSGIQTLVDTGAKCLVGGDGEQSDRCAMANTLLTVDGEAFLRDPEGFQSEAFGNAALVVRTKNAEQTCRCLSLLEGNLTGCVYSSKSGDDDLEAREFMFALEPRVGRLLNDKMPTGVAVSAAMNHGGPYPATGHPGFTAVGVPGSLLRFAKLTSFDNVRQDRLPEILRDPPHAAAWRRIDGAWSQAAVG
ncbi:MAG: aldehyde dehydrogenase (NADP(+)) [Planctomycetota bacterium]